MATNGDRRFTSFSKSRPSPPGTDLRASALLLCRQYDLGNTRVEELLNTVRSVMQSEVWERSRNALRCFTELPFETVPHGENVCPTVTRGVIDLLFEESDGWVVVDYKTDDITEADIEKRGPILSATASAVRKTLA